MTVYHPRALAAAAWCLLATTPLPTQFEERATDGVCLREGERLVGERPIVPGRLPFAPGTTVPSQPDFPPAPLGVDGVWRGEVLIDISGKVARVWALEEMASNPQLSSYRESVIAAVGRWQVEPLMLNDKVVPACLSLIRWVH